MTNPDSLYALLLFISFVSCIVVSLIVWRRRDRRGAKPILLFMLAMAEWSLTYAIHWLVTEPEQRWFWLNMTYFGAVTVPVAFFFFALIYTNRDQWLSQNSLWLLLFIIPPALVLLLLWSDESHNLFFGGKRTPDATMFLEGGVGFWLNIGYSYLLILIGFVLLWQMYFQVSQPYRRQVGIILLGAFLPWLSNIFALAGVRPLGLDITPFIFVLAGIILMVGLFRTGLLDLVPVARSYLIDTMADGVLVLDMADRVVDINPSAAKLFGRDQSDIIGRPIDEALVNWPDELNRLHRLPNGREEIKLNSQPPRYFNTRITPLYDEQQRPTGRLIIWHDTSEQKQIELEQKKLIQELNAYAHTVAHDLKNPLTRTIGYSDLLMAAVANSTDERQAVYLERIKQSSYQMLNIIDELLTLATVRGLEHIPLEALDMAVWVQSAIERLEMPLLELEADVDLPEHWPLAIGYGPWVEEVWANYISNALKYGGRPPQVTLGADLLPLGTVRFWVKDNGQGLDEAAQERLFQEFERLGQMQVSGHGLGLSVVRRIMERLDGDVGVESEVGQGSLFFFTLPAATEPLR